MAIRSFFLRACEKVEENRDVYKERAAETKAHTARLVDMQRYVNMSSEKRSLLMDLIKNGRSSDSDESLLEKGVIVYIEYLDVIATISNAEQGSEVAALVEDSIEQMLSHERDPRSAFSCSDEKSIPVFHRISCHAAVHTKGAARFRSCRSRRCPSRHTAPCRSSSDRPAYPPPRS